MNILARPGAVRFEPAQHFVLHFIPWDGYEAIIEALDGQHVRTAYDRGSLEFMSPQPIHEIYKTLLDRFFFVIGFEADVPMKAFGSTTFRRRARQRGLEPDLCYYLASIGRIRDWRMVGREGPVPDLAIEIDNTHASLDRLSIYAGLGVPEVWRFDGETLESHQLRRGRYRRVPRSAALPFVPLEDVPALLHQGRDTQNDRALLQLYSEWVRTRVLPAKEAAERRRGRRPKA
jgi:Uma2 family endonuclease